MTSSLLNTNFPSLRDCGAVEAISNMIWNGTDFWDCFVAHYRSLLAMTEIRIHPTDGHDF